MLQEERPQRSIRIEFIADYHPQEAHIRPLVIKQKTSAEEENEEEEAKAVAN